MRGGGFGLVVLALLVGTGVGYLLGQGQRAPARRSRAENSVIVPQRPTAEADLARRFIDSVEPLERRQGDGVIRGSVKTSDQKPVAGVVITASPDWEAPQGSFPEDPSLEQQARASTAYAKWRRFHRGRATTASDGSFQITGLVRDRYRLIAKHGHYEVKTRGSIVKPDATVDFVATAVVPFDLTVLMPDGTPPKYASVYCKPEQGGEQGVSWGPRYRRIRLAPGKYTLRAVAGRGREYRSGSVALVLQAGDAPREVTLRLVESPGIKGRVRWPDKIMLRRAPALHALRFTTTPPDDARLMKSRLRARVRREQDHYRYRFLDLEPGRYLIGVVAGLREVEARAVVELTGGTLVHDLDLPAPDERYLRVQVTGPDDQPLDDVSFRYEMSAAHFGGASGVLELRGRDGTFFLRPPDWSEHATKKALQVLTVGSRKFGSERIRLDPSAKRLQVKFDRPATVLVTVEGLAGSGHEDAMRLAIRRPTAPRKQRHGGAAPDHEGKVTMQPIPPGEMELVLGIDTNSLFWPVARRLVTLKPGENRVAIGLPPLYPLKILGEKGERVRISPVGEENDRLILYRSLDKQGEAEVPRLPAGSFELTGYKEGKTWRVPFTLPGASELRTP